MMHDQKEVDDMISRRAALDICDNAIDSFKGKFGAGVLDAIRESIAELPPAERDTAEWIESEGQKILLEDLIKKGEVWRVCSKCGAGFMIGYKYECDKMYHETFHNFCPKCGRRMVLVQ